MFYNNKDYFFFSGVKNVFRKCLNDPEIDNKEIVFVLKMKNFPFRTITRKKGNNDIAVGIYDKDVIRSYFDGTEKTEEIRRIIDKYRNDDIADLYAQLTTRKNYQPDDYKNKSYQELWNDARNRNKEKMIEYLDSLDKNQEEDMDYVSKELLADDEVMYESKEDNLSDVETEWKPKEGLFLSKSPRGIANYLLKHSKDKSQAMKRLTFYMNRAGENLKNKTVLNKAKDLLKSDDANEGWKEIEGIGYVKDRSFNIRMNLDEAYSDLKMLQKYEDIPSEEYLEKFPNLKLARMLGNKLLVGNNWKKSKYRRSYYFNIDMSINNPIFKGRKIHGLLRISDHKVNPYRFAEEFGKDEIIDVDGKKRKNGERLKIEYEDGKFKEYAFGISITLPSTNDLTISKTNVDCEPHVFEYISQNTQDKELGQLKSKLENIVNRIETAYVGTDKNDDFSPYEYKEVTTGDAIFKISSEDRYLYNRNKLIKSGSNGQVKSERQTLKSRKIKQLDFPSKNLNYYMNELGMEPNIITVNERKKQANQTVNYKGETYRAWELEGVLRPYNFKSKTVVGLNDGLYVWKDKDGNIVNAAIVENRRLRKIQI